MLVKTFLRYLIVFFLITLLFFILSEVTDGFLGGLFEAYCYCFGGITINYFVWYRSLKKKANKRWLGYK